MSKASLKLFLLSWLILEQTLPRRKVIFCHLLLKPQEVSERFCKCAAVEGNATFSEDHAEPDLKHVYQTPFRQLLSVRIFF